MTSLHNPTASAFKARSLADWLEHLSVLHPKNIELGLVRVARVYRKLKLDFSACTVVTVAGTNGKGTTCVMLEQASLMAGKSVAVYSSPHLLDYRERVRVNGSMLDEAAHCRAFSKVEQARGDVALTYFEFGTLAALQLMHDAGVDILLLEVGLGGRLDAVNVLDPDIAVITSIDLDHQDWLGTSKEQIAGEKAGILRAKGLAVIGEPQPLQALISAVEKLEVQASFQGKDFYVKQTQNGFDWSNGHIQLSDLPMPNIPLQNASTALQVMQLLKFELDVPQLTQVLAHSHLPGRQQLLQSAPDVLLDVAHNPHATTHLHRLVTTRHYRNIYLVAGMLKDKDIASTFAPLYPLKATWLLGSLDVPRGATAGDLKTVLDQGQKALEFATISQAYRHAIESADKQDLIVVFGSFFTIAEVLKLNQELRIN
ncbi:MAG: dihydrofolate synthase/folylpolyglutamate synthase [Paraglaciecola sp.]|jgi:dihydrofolate synthase/folylpolyglutamate synthase